MKMYTTGLQQYLVLKLKHIQRNYNNSHSLFKDASNIITTVICVTYPTETHKRSSISHIIDYETN